ncbi:MAG: peroxiredoxin [Pseudomonadota bacterium]
MALNIGDTLPSMTLKTVTADGPSEIETDSLFKGKTVVLVGMPGAFTGTCSLNHLPGIVENADAIKAKGVDEIAVLTVNDPFVSGAWADQSGGKDKIVFLADWDIAFTKAIGMDIDLGVAGLGVRSKRYSMIVRNGVVETLNVEESPGDADVSGAAAILNQL